MARLPALVLDGATALVTGAAGGMGEHLARGLAREEVTDRTTRANTAMNTVWRNEYDGRAVLKITPEGLAAIGVEPETAPATPVKTEAAPDEFTPARTRSVSRSGSGSSTFQVDPDALGNERSSFLEPSEPL